MNNFRKTIALLLCLCMVASAALSLAEAQDGSQTVTDVATGDVTQAVAVTAPELADTDVLATVNGTPITWGEVQEYYDGLVSYYGEPDATMVETYRAFALETTITMTLTNQTAAANGLDQYTEEEKAAVYQTADTDWQNALDSWVANNQPLSETATEAEKTDAYAKAAAYFSEMGYDQQKLRDEYMDSETYKRVTAFVTKDIAVTDEEVLAQYNANVTNDQALYENDVDAYEYQLMLYNNQYATEKPWYHPAGYRFVKHILLEVDEALLSKYNDLQARLEESMDAETEAAEASAAPEATEAAATDAAATPEPTQEPVSQADVDNAKAEILASLEAKTTEIYDKIAAGSDFDTLIAEYALKADGVTATDPGMVGGDYPNGYEVGIASATFVPAFVEAAFSIAQVGEVSAPYISEYGVHIVKYMADVPAGAVELTDALKTTLRESLLSERSDTALTAWQAAADIAYTGLVPSMAELQSAEATDAAE